MSGDELRVTSAHLGELAAKQGYAAGGITSATILPEGVDAAVRTTHGSISTASANALAAVLVARSGAGAKMAALSNDLCDKLIAAAKRYDQMDEAISGNLGRRMQPGQT